MRCAYYHFLLFNDYFLKSFVIFMLEIFHISLSLSPAPCHVLFLSVHLSISNKQYILLTIYSISLLPVTLR